MFARRAFVAVFAALLVSGGFASPASAVPPGISVAAITPADGSTLFVARTAANNPLDPPTFQLKADVYLQNLGGMDQVVTSVTFSYPGSGISDRTYTPQSFDSMGNPSLFTIPAIDVGRVPIYDGLGRDLPLPLPPAVQIEITFGLDPDPLELEFELAIRDNTTTLGSYFFPAKASDLDPDQHWIWLTRHTVDAGGGGGTLNPSTRSQRYGYDFGVARWTGTTWSELVDGAPGAIADRENDDYLIWETPLYAAADGTIVSCYRGEMDHDPDIFANITFENGGGNELIILHGNERVSYSHMQFGTIPLELCPNDGQNDGLNIPISAGQSIGLVGNTGRSTNPHLHFHSQFNPAGGPDNLEGVPLQFVNVRALGDDKNVANLGNSPNLRPLHGKTLHRHSLILPNPCGLDDLPPAGSVEVAKHGIPGECYQDVVNQIVSRGYRPAFVDGFEVGGNLFFNAIFRPSEGTWLARHGLTGTEYQDLFDDLTDDGFRLHQVDSYVDSGSVRYAAIFEVRPGPAFAAFHGLNDAEYSDKIDELAAADLVPVNVSTVEVGGQLFWTGLFEHASVTGWTVETVQATDYQDTFDANVDAGRLPIYVHGFVVSGAPYITAIWVDPIGGSWAAVHGRTGSEYQIDWNVNTGAGRWTRAVSGYDNGAGSARFAAVWRVRPNTSLTATPPSITNQTSATFEFTSNNPFATFECRLGGGPFTSCSSPRLLTGLSEGFHTFQVRALDRHRLRDLTPASDTWLVDVTPPEVSFVGPPLDSKTVFGVLKDDPVDVTTIVGWGDVSATATDNLSGVASVEFEVNGVPVPDTDVTQVGDTWTFTFVPDLNGENVYTIEVTATDNADNSASETFEVLGVKTNKPMP